MNRTEQKREAWINNVLRVYPNYTREQAEALHKKVQTPIGNYNLTDDELIESVISKHAIVISPEFREMCARLKKKNRCEFEQHVELYFGLSECTETTEIKTDFGQLVNLLATFKKI